MSGSSALPESSGISASQINEYLPVIGLLLGVASWMGVLLLASVPAVIIGHIVRSDPYREGRGLALVGMLLGYANIITVILLLFILLSAL